MNEPSPPPQPKYCVDCGKDIPGGKIALARKNGGIAKYCWFCGLERRAQYHKQRNREC